MSTCLRMVLFLIFAVPWGTALAGPVECGDRPISLAFFEFGVLYDHGVGIDRDLVDELARRSGCRLETQVMARARIWNDLANGHLDMATAGISTPERDRFAWIAPYGVAKSYVVIRASLGATIKGAEDFLANPKLQFGAVTPLSYGMDQDRWLAQLRQANRVQDVPELQLNFMKLKAGRIDAMFSTNFVSRKYLHDLDMEKDVVIQDWTPGETWVTGGLVLAKSRFSEAQAERWRVLLRQLRDDGTLKRIFSRYMPEAEAAKTAGF